MQDRDLVRFNVLRNALYHQGRRRALERWNRFVNFLVILLGAAAVGDVLSEVGISQAVIAAAVTVLATLQLVFDIGRAARDHQAMVRDYYVLLSDIEGTVDHTEADCAAWQARMIRITAEEPPVLKARDAKAYNDALDALEWQREERLRIPVLHRLLGGILPFDGHEYRKFSQSG